MNAFVLFSRSPIIRIEMFNVKQALYRFAVIQFNDVDVAILEYHIDMDGEFIWYFNDVLLLTLSTCLLTYFTLTMYFVSLLQDTI